MYMGDYIYDLRKKYFKYMGSTQDKIVMEPGHCSHVLQLPLSKTASLISSCPVLPDAAIKQIQESLNNMGFPEMGEAYAGPESPAPDLPRLPSPLSCLSGYP